MLSYSFDSTDRTLALYIANGLNGVGLAVASMTKSPDDVELQCFACFFMWKLAHHDELNEQLVQSGVHRLLLKAIETHETETVCHAGNVKDFGQQALVMLLP